MSSESNYYIRAKGKVTGPVSMETLKKLVHRGIVAAAHEISSDRTNWKAAGKYPELFPPRTSSAARAPQTAPSQTERPPAPAATPQPTHTARAANYYYSQGGVDIGPVGADVLRSLVQNGTIRADDMVWPAGAQMAVPARQMPLLAAAFSTSEYSTASSRMPTGAAPDVSRIAIGIRNVALTVGLIVGIALLLLLNLPWLVVNGRTFWWWTLTSTSHAPGVTVFCVLILLMGLALCVVTPLLTGVPRGVAFVVISGLAVLFVVLEALSSNSPGDTFLGIMAIQVGPAITTLLLLSLRARFALMGASSSTCTGTQLTAAIIQILIAASLLFWLNSVPPLAPSALHTAVAVLIIACLAGLAAAILAIIDFGAGPSRRLCTSGMICSLLSLGGQLLAVTLVVLAMAQEFRSYRGVIGPLPSGLAYDAVSRFLTVSLHRLWLMILLPALLAGVGAAEMMLARYAVGRRAMAPLSHSPGTRSTEAADALSHMVE